MPSSVGRLTVWGWGGVLLLILMMGLPDVLAQEEITEPPQAQEPGDSRVLGAIRGLADKRPEVRAEAALFFVNEPDPRAFEPLLRLVDPKQEPVEDVRVNAVRALGEIGKKEAYEPLLRVLDEEPRETVQWVAVIALGKINEPRAFGRLKEILEGEDHPEWHNLAAYALGYTKSPEAIDVLAKALVSPDMRVRRDSARALRVLQEPEGCKLLLAQLPVEPSGQAMRAIVDALGFLQCKDAPKVFEEMKKKLDTTQGEYIHLDAYMDRAVGMIETGSEQK